MLRASAEYTSGRLDVLRSWPECGQTCLTGEKHINGPPYSRTCELRPQAPQDLQFTESGWSEFPPPPQPYGQLFVINNSYILDSPCQLILLLGNMYFILCHIWYIGYLSSHSSQQSKPSFVKQQKRSQDGEQKLVLKNGL